MHDVVVGLLCVEVLDAVDTLAVIAGGERRDAVYQSLGDGVVAQVDVVLVTYGDGYVDRPCPVTLCQHLQNHEVALVECMLALERDDHAIGNGV